MKRRFWVCLALMLPAAAFAEEADADLDSWNAPVYWERWSFIDHAMMGLLGVAFVLAIVAAARRTRTRLAVALCLAPFLVGTATMWQDLLHYTALQHAQWCHQSPVLYLYTIPFPFYVGTAGTGLALLCLALSRLLQQYHFAVSALASVAIAALFWLVPEAWRPLPVRHLEVSLTTGEQRIRTSLWGFELGVEAWPTNLSWLAFDKGRAEMPPASWRVVHTFAPRLAYTREQIVWGSVTPMQNVDILFISAAYSAEAKRQIARNILKLWEQSGDPNGAKEYIETLLRAFHATDMQISAEAVAKFDPTL